MRPAFSSNRGAVAFTLLVGLLLWLPWLAARSRWLDRRQVYPTIGWRFGALPWIQQKIFSETSDVDIAFLGSSMLWTDVDAAYVQRQLSERLNRRAQVFTLGWNESGFDALYIVARDLLEHRRCRTLVIYEEPYGTRVPQRMVYKTYRVGEFSDALFGLPRADAAALYAGAVLGMPRHLLSLIRPNLIEPPNEWPTNPLFAIYDSDDLTLQNGALRVHSGFGESTSFHPYTPKTTVTPAEVLVCLAETRHNFEQIGTPPPPYQFHFARKLAGLCAEHGTQLVILHLPEFDSRSHGTVQSSTMWPEVLGPSVQFVGIPEAKLFAGLEAGDVKKLFSDARHLNLNGQDFFTPLITPALIKLYVESNRP